MKERARLVAARHNEGWSQEEVAERIEVNRVTVSQWERGITDPYPIHIQRLCKLFRKEAAELDLGKVLSPHIEQSSPLPQETAAPEILASPTSNAGASLLFASDLENITIQAYEDVLTLAWETFYTSNAQRATSVVEHWLLFLKQQMSPTAAKPRDQFKELLCRFLQLGSVLARDRTDFLYAFEAVHEAIALAFRLENSELIASSLYRRAKLYAAQQHYNLAVRDLEAAIPYANHSRKPLRCYIFMFLAEMYSLAAPGNGRFFRKSLDLLDEVDREVRAYNILEGDGSFVKVDVSGLYMIRGDVLRRAGEIDKGRNALKVVKESLPKEFTRWQGNLHISTSQLFFADGDVANGCKYLHSAIDVFQSTNSRSGLAKTQREYRSLQVTEPLHSDVKQLEARLKTL